MACHIAICDDEKSEVERLEHFLNRYSEEEGAKFEIDTYTRGEDLVDKYWKNKSPYDIILLDMELETVHGIDVAREIRNVPDYRVIIAFITSHPDYMQQGYDVQASQYLLKPLGYAEFREKMTYLLGLRNQNRADMMTLREKSKETMVDVTEIQCVETIKRTSERTKLKFTLYDDFVTAVGSISEYEEKLRGKGFARIHRGVVVNLRCIYKFQGDNVILKSGIVLPVGRKYAKELRDRFSDFFVTQFRN